MFVYQENVHKALWIDETVVVKIRKIDHFVNFHVRRIFASGSQRFAEISSAQESLAIFDEEFVNI